MGVGFLTKMQVSHSRIDPFNSNKKGKSYDFEKYDLELKEFKKIIQ